MPKCQLCLRSDASACAYRDDNGNACDTIWCPDHGVPIGPAIYCRRHAGVINALAESVNDGHIPEMDNRAPSLANWMAQGLDERILKLLNEAIRPGSSEQVISERLTHVLTAYRTHLWERWWKVVDGDDVILKVGIDVDETKDDEVRIRVGNRTIMSVVPPWISQRYRSAIASDHYARDEFYDMLAKAMSDAIGLMR
jgi:hypothetical protein